MNGKRRCGNIYNGILLTTKKDGILLFATIWMVLEGTMLNEVSQKEKKDTVCFHLYVESKK